MPTLRKSNSSYYSDFYIYRIGRYKIALFKNLLDKDGYYYWNIAKVFSDGWLKEHEEEIFPLRDSFKTNDIKEAIIASLKAIEKYNKTELARLKLQYTEDLKEFEKNKEFKKYSKENLLKEQI